ncbi:hypothetical protein EMIT0P43_20616 [Pseudomonas jessenii]
MVRSVGVCRSAFARLFCGSGLAREGGLTAERYFADVPSPCGSGLARDGSLSADHFLSDAPRPNCGSGLAREDGGTVDIAFSATPQHIVSTRPRGSAARDGPRYVLGVSAV